MAMAEEFDYVSYVCAYCGRFNPARKQRPAAPLLAARPLPALQNNSMRGMVLLFIVYYIFVSIKHRLFLFAFHCVPFLCEFILT